MKQMFFLLISFLLFASCDQYKRKRDIKNTIETLIGNNVILPDSLEFFYPDSYIEKPRDFNVQIYSCIDGNCGVCTEDLKLWNEFIMQNEMANEVNFNFFVNAYSYSELEKFFNKKRFTFPFIKDSTSAMIRLSKLPERNIFHTFLAINNKIVIVGNPMRNEKLKELYLRTINKELFGKEIVGAE
jgi:hypothetical protein